MSGPKSGFAHQEQYGLKGYDQENADERIDLANNLSAK